jgi:hypothetical protein
MATALAAARYGKDKIRVFRVVRDGNWHSVVEYNVTVLVEGDIGTRCVLRFITGPDTHRDFLQLHSSGQLCGGRYGF